MNTNTQIGRFSIWGMLDFYPQPAFDVSAELGFCAESELARLRNHCDAVGLPRDLSIYGFTAERLMSHMHHDKKVRNGDITFILARGIGQALIVSDVDMAKIERLLTRRLSQN